MSLFEEEAPAKRARVELKRRESEEPRENAFSVDAALDRISGLLFCSSQFSGPGFKVIDQPPREAAYDELSEDHGNRLNKHVSARFCNLVGLPDLKLYCHQAEAITHIFNGENVCISTSTSSGKSLAFNLPVLSDILDPCRNCTAIYIYPTKALAQDQKRVLDTLLPDPGVVAIFDGDTEADARNEVKASARLILTNPDMIHCTLLKQHKKFKDFFSKLTYVVIDEAHSYRGSFGSHVGSVIRRLIRITKFHRTRVPQFICCSATIGNALEHTQRLVGLPVCRLVDKDGSPAGRRKIVVLKCGVGSAAALNTSKVLAELVIAGGRVICFSRYRAEVEHLLQLSKAALAQNNRQDSVVGYRAGYSAEERRKLERAIFSGETAAVISTTALELGVDIGALDCAISLGFPGSFRSLWQQFGRSGRSTKDCLCFLMCREDDPIDLWLSDDVARVGDMSQIEDAVIQVDHADIVEAHLLCADAEIELRRDKIDFEKNQLWPCCDAAFAAALKAAPFMKGAHGKVKLRSIAKRKIRVMLDNETIDELDISNAFLSVYPGAIHNVQGRELKIVDLDLVSDIATCVPSAASYFTRPRDKTDVRPAVPALRERMYLGGGRIEWAKATVSTVVDGFSKLDKKTQQSEEFEAFEPLSVEYKSFVVNCVLTLPETEALAAEGLCVASCLHAATHLLLKSAQIRILCDRSDIKAVCPDPEAFTPNLMLFDTRNGGLGIAENIFQKFETLLPLAKHLVEKCTCSHGCPRCVQMPSCSGYNKSLSKDGAVKLLQLLMDRV